MSDVEQEAGVAVCTLLQDVRRIHSRNVDCLRMVITEYFDCQRHAPMQQLRDIEAASAVISNMDAADYQNTIVEVYRSLSSGDLHDGDDVDTKLVQALQQTSKVGHLPFQFDVQNMVQHQVGIPARRHSGSVPLFRPPVPLPLCPRTRRVPVFHPLPAPPPPSPLLNFFSPPYVPQSTPIPLPHSAGDLAPV